MLRFELLDETLDLNQTSHYHLSLQASPDGFLYAILDTVRAKYVGLKSYSFDRADDPAMLNRQIQALLDADPFLQRSYKGVSCIQVENRSTLLPAALFDREHLKLYFTFNHLLHDLDELHFNYLKQADAYLVFPVHTEIAGLYLNRWVNTRFYHQATPLIDLLLSSGQEEGKITGINFNSGHFDIVAVENGKLRYHNTFNFRSDEDLFYFVLLVFDKLGFDPENTPLHLSGELDKLSERPSRMKRYFRKIIFQSAPPGFQYPSSFHGIQEHTLLNLLRIYRCE